MGVFWRGIPYFIVEGSASLLSATAIAIETGTYRGDSTDVLAGFFPEVISIERDVDLAKSAAKRFVGKENIRVLEGSSLDLLNVIMPDRERPTLFWLDAHYSGGVTAGNNDPCPLIDEIILISRRRTADNTVVLIDDARSLTGHGGWPTVDEVCSKFDLETWSMAIIDDVMICSNRSYLRALISEPEKLSRLFELEKLAGEWIPLRRVMKLAQAIAIVRHVKKRMTIRIMSYVRFLVYICKKGYYFVKRSIN